MAARPSEIGPVGLFVGETVARLRGDRGWDQRSLVERLAAAGTAMSQPILSRIEGGARRVDADELLALAAVFHVVVADLLPPTGEVAVAVPTSRVTRADDSTGPVGSALADDIEQLGDLVGMEPTLAATAVRLARQIDGYRPVPCDDCGSLVHVPADRILPQLTRELRATVAALLEGRTVDDDTDDGLDDLGAV